VERCTSLIAIPATWFRHPLPPSQPCFDAPLQHWVRHTDEFENLMILHICPEDTRLDRLHEIEDKYGLFRPRPQVPPGHQFLAKHHLHPAGVAGRLL